MSNRIPLSVVVIAKNEEGCIEKCLSSVYGWADEIIVIDDCSTDRTAEIAGKYGKVTRAPWDIEGKFRNWAYSLASNNWILSLDADECVSEELKKEISAAVKNPFFAAYNIPLRNFIGDYWVKNGGWYPAAKTRLFLKNNFRYEESEVHPRAFINGKCGNLKGEIIHRSYRDIGEFLNSINNQTTLEARKWLRSGRKMTLWKACWRTIDRFFRRFLGKRGYRDGLYGFVIAFYDSLYQVLSYLKFLELKRSKK